MSDRPKLYHEADLFEVMLHHSPETLYPEESHETVQICIPFEGARYQVKRSTENGTGLTHTLSAHDILILPDRQPHAIHWQAPADILSLQLSKAFLEQALGKARLDLRDNLVVRDRFLSDAAVELRRAALSDDAPPLLLGAFAAMIAYRIGHAAENHVAGLAGAVHPFSAGERSRIHQYVNANLDRPIRLEELARLTNQSQWHFLRRFTATEGVSPISFLTERRIEKAAALLTGSSLTVTEVALEVGMSLSHLSRTFLQRRGVSPSVFRRQHR